MADDDERNILHLRSLRGMESVLKISSFVNMNNWLLV